MGEWAGSHRFVYLWVANFWISFQLATSFFLAFEDRRRRSRTTLDGESSRRKIAARWMENCENAHSLFHRIWKFSRLFCLLLWVSFVFPLASFVFFHDYALPFYEGTRREDTFRSDTWGCSLYEQISRLLLVTLERKRPFSLLFETYESKIAFSWWDSLDEKASFFKMMFCSSGFIFILSKESFSPSFGDIRRKDSLFFVEWRSSEEKDRSFFFSYGHSKWRVAIYLSNYPNSK